MSAFLYCIEAHGAGIAKVGVSRDPRSRFYSFCQTAPYEMKYRRVLLMKSTDLAYAHERVVISSANRFRDKGEWVLADQHLDNLLERVDYVSDDTALFDKSSSGRPIISPDRATDLLREAELKDKVGIGASKFLPKSNITPERFRDAVIRARLDQGYGAQDVLVMDGIPENEYWAVVNEMRAAKEAGA